MIKVVRGKALTEDLNYPLAATQTIAAGDCVQITSDGAIELATATACHGMALQAGAPADAGDMFPFLRFAADTVLEITLPTDVSVDTGTVVKGSRYTLLPTTQLNAITVETSGGILEVVGYPSDDQIPVDPATGGSIDFDAEVGTVLGTGGTVYVTLTQAAIDARTT